MSDELSNGEPAEPAEKKPNPGPPAGCFAILIVSLVSLAITALVSLAITALLIDRTKQCPLTFEEFVAQARANRFCSVEQYEGARVEWLLPGLAIIETGSFYSTEALGWDVNVWPDCNCDCAPELVPAALYRVRGRIMTLVPGRVSIWEASIEPAGPRENPPPPAPPGVGEPEASAETVVVPVEPLVVPPGESIRLEITDEGLKLYDSQGREVPTRPAEPAELEDRGV